MLRHLLVRVSVSLIILWLLSAAPVRALAVNEKLPSFACPAAEGAPVNSADLSGKVVAICFTATWAKHSQEELLALQNLTREFKDKGLLVLPVFVREDKAKAVDFCARSKVTLRLLLDDGTVARAFGVNGLPAVFVIDRSGTVHERLIGYGPTSPESLRKAVAPLVNEPKPVKPERKTPPVPAANSDETPAPPGPADVPPSLRVYSHLKLGAAHIDIGDAFINAGQRDAGHYLEAIREFKAGLVLEPKNVNLLVWLGVAYERKGDQAEAVRQYQLALLADPENTYAKDSLRRLRALPPAPPPPAAAPQP